MKTNPDSFCEASITLILKPDKDIAKPPTELQTNNSYVCGYVSFKHNCIKSNPTIYKRIITHGHVEIIHQECKTDLTFVSQLI